ncbi:MAG: hypothetical protein IPM24_05585 [Bryobacterales bacterium]|nr:hypothetical protein [Bryobacterales bacterium]
MRSRGDAAPRKRANVYLKVQIEFDERETPERLGEELCRQLRRVYGVRHAELSGVNSEE